MYKIELPWNWYLLIYNFNTIVWKILIWDVMFNTTRKNWHNFGCITFQIKNTWLVYCVLSTTNSIELINALILFLSKATRHKTQFLSLCKFNLVLFWSLCKSDSIISDLCQVESDLGPTDCCCDVYVIVTRVFMET